MLKHHPAGLSTLFFMEMWERMSYYGMRALLVLFMVDQIQSGGMGWTDETATAVYGLYTASVYLVCLPGGWIADRLLGAQRTVLIGAVVICCGHFVLAIPAVWSFIAGLCLVVLGTGLLKPNISAIVGELYEDDDPRRDAGFTLFYMGINLGAAIGPLICSTLGESDRFGWHWGFAAAGVGMLIGIGQYLLGRHKLKDAGLAVKVPIQNNNQVWLVLGICLLVCGLVILSLTNGMKLTTLAKWTTAIIATIFCLYFIIILFFSNLKKAEQKNVLLIFVLCAASAFFWAGFEQAGSSFNLFADRYTDRQIFNFDFPAGWFQSLNPLFIIILAPIIASLWVKLASHNLNPSYPVKFALAFIFLAAGFFVIMLAAKIVTTGQQVLPYWLITTYLLHTIGELCLSPVGLSAISRLSPNKYTGQMMGLWFLAASLGSIIAGLLAGGFNSENILEMPSLFGQIAYTSLLVVVCLILFALFTSKKLETK